MSPYLARRRVRARSGFTLVESVLFAALALVILVILLGFYTRAFRLFDTGTRTAGLVVDARRLFERLTRDVRFALLVTQPLTRSDWARDRRLTLYRLADPDGRKRLRDTPGPDAREYPFFSDRADETTQRLASVEISYVYDAHSVTRLETPGTMQRTARRGEPLECSFSPSGEPVRDSLASRVTAFDVTPLALLDSGNLALALPDGSPSSPHRIALLAFAYRAEDRPVDAPSTSDAGVLEIATKVWLDERSLDLRFPGFFSSLDTDLEF